jgi:2-(1,2-epoxy-1,2-dihydrophenyl)acetyl-CoA isomerase
MIYEAIADDGFETYWRTRAEHLANGPTAAYRHLKTALRESQNNTLEQQLDVEARLQGKCGQTRDFREGVISFLEKREPKFEGR